MKLLECCRAKVAPELWEEKLIYQPSRTRRVSPLQLYELHAWQILFAGRRNQGGTTKRHVAPIVLERMMGAFDYGKWQINLVR